MSELTIGQMKFAREIGATWRRDSTNTWMKEIYGKCYIYDRHDSCWSRSSEDRHPSEWESSYEIDFSPLDDHEASHNPIQSPDYNPADVAFKSTSDGSTASYYELPTDCTELQDLISYRNMNAQDGEIFRAIYRKGRASRSDALRDAKKVLFYAQAEVERLQRYME